MYEVGQFTGIEVSNSDSVLEEIERLLGTLILDCNAISDEDRTDHIERVRSLYFRSFKYNEGPPNIADVQFAVVEENWNIILKIAELDFQCTDPNVGVHEAIRATFPYFDDEAILSEIAEYWFETYGGGSSEALRYYVEELICEEKHSYRDHIVDVQNAYYYFNDCQNLLIEEWQLCMLKSIESEPSVYGCSLSRDDYLSVRAVPKEVE